MSDEDKRSAAFQTVLVVAICVVLALAWLLTPNDELDEQLERQKKLNEEMRQFR